MEFNDDVSCQRPKASVCRVEYEVFRFRVEIRIRHVGGFVYRNLCTFGIYREISN